MRRNCALSFVEFSDLRNYFGLQEVPKIPKSEHFVKELKVYRVPSNLAGRTIQTETSLKTPKLETFQKIYIFSKTDHYRLFPKLLLTGKCINVKDIGNKLFISSQ